MTSFYQADLSKIPEYEALIAKLSKKYKLTSKRCATIVETFLSILLDHVIETMYTFSRRS